MTTSNILYLFYLYLLSFLPVTFKIFFSPLFFLSFFDPSSPLRINLFFPFAFSLPSFLPLSLSLFLLILSFYSSLFSFFQSVGVSPLFQYHWTLHYDEVSALFLLRFVMILRCIINHRPLWFVTNRPSRSTLSLLHVCGSNFSPNPPCHVVIVSVLSEECYDRIWTYTACILNWHVEVCVTWNPQFQGAIASCTLVNDIQPPFSFTRQMRSGFNLFEPRGCLLQALPLEDLSSSSIRPNVMM